MAETQRVDCRKCKYYYVTWDNSFPNGCKAYGIKSRETPSALVYRSTGNTCSVYDKKR